MNECKHKLYDSTGKYKKKNHRFNTTNIFLKNIKELSQTKWKKVIINANRKKILIKKIRSKGKVEQNTGGIESHLNK